MATESSVVEMKAAMPTKEDLSARLERQKAAQTADGVPDAARRIDRINRLIDIVAGNKDAFCQAMSDDYGNRSRGHSLIADIAGTLTQLKFARRNLKRWMRPEPAHVDAPLWLFGSRARIEYQPLGVVGVVSPWNFPVYLSIGPLGEIFAAGNRAMIKPSELTPATSDLLGRLLAKAFDPDEVSVVTGGPDVGAAFAALPFDHLLFTGAGSIARHILHAAADNLTPVTLELGGKSPVVVGKDADIGLAAERIAAGKLFNSGQVCLAPDYVLVPKDKTEKLVEALTASIAAAYPTLRDNPDYTSIISDRHLERVRDLVEEARAKGARIIEVQPSDAAGDNANSEIIAPTIIVDPDDELDVMRKEIFGPVLPIKSYSSIDEAIAHINTHDRPLALYYFGDNKSEQDCVLANTVSGGVTINDVIMHSTQNSLPFGGVGASGTGAYHGVHGFRRFSHARAVYKQTSIDAIFKALRPPFGAKFEKMIAGMVKG